MSLEDWAAKPNDPPLFGTDRSQPAARFVNPTPPAPWLTRLRLRLGAWLQSW